MHFRMTKLATDACGLYLDTNEIRILNADFLGIQVRLNTRQNLPNLQLIFFTFRKKAWEIEISSNYERKEG